MDNKVYTDSVAGLLLSGDIKLGIGQANGWQPIGKPHKITKAKQNTIKEIDKKIAAELYNEYFEKSFDEIKNNGICKLGINYPIGTHLTNKNKEYLTRTPLAIEENGSLILNADIHEEEDISLMIGDKEIILESAKNAVSTALNHINNERIGFAVIFSDISRLLLLRKNAYKEIDIIKDAIGKNIPILGCYTFGEYGPFEIEQSKDQYYFNNHSICIALFSE